jgi:hypothetical protein
MYGKNLFVGILVVGCFVTASVAAPSVGYAQADPRVTKSMDLEVNDCEVGSAEVGRQ